MKQKKENTFFPFIFSLSTMVQKNQGSRRKYWITCSSARSFANTTHSFACSALLALLAHSVTLIRSLTLLLPYELMGKRVNSMKGTQRFHTVLSHCVSLSLRARRRGVAVGLSYLQRLQRLMTTPTTTTMTTPTTTTTTAALAAATVAKMKRRKTRAMKNGKKR